MDVRRPGRARHGYFYVLRARHCPGQDERCARSADTRSVGAKYMGAKSVGIRNVGAKGVSARSLEAFSTVL